MTVAHTPAEFDESFAAILQSSKRDFVSDSSAGSSMFQHGAARITPARAFPGWPRFGDDATPALSDSTTISTDATIETYLITGTEPPMPTSDNEPFVSTWLPLVDWFASAMRAALEAHGLVLVNPGYVTASRTASALLEGQAHMDDDAYVPDDNVGVVAIVGQHIGPRVASQTLEVEPLRAMSQVQFAEDTLRGFEADDIDHCAGEPNQIVVFPQFGQLHAGPPAAPVVAMAARRQLMVFRAGISR